MLRSLGSVFAFCLMAVPALAASPARVEVLLDALNFPQMAEVMSQEGDGFGAQIEQDMFPTRGGDRWAAIVSEIYAPERIEAIMGGALADSLSPEDAEAVISFFESEPGAEIADYELAARAAFLEEAVEEAAEAQVDQMSAENSPRLAQVERFIAANNLIDQNVSGGLNSNYAFFLGLRDAGALPELGSEEEMLAQIWGQEPEIRDSAETWLSAFLTLAFDPLSDDDIEAYIAFSETASGRALNQALFDGFGEMFRQISRDMGIGAGQFMQSGQDL